MNKKLMGTLLVTLAASAAMAQTEPAKKAAETKAEMVCQNNNCKGKADCMGFGNASCHGENSCKGHGILKAKDKAECDKKHGKWTAKK